jgi:hypothetical protein
VLGNPSTVDRPKLLNLTGFTCSEGATSARRSSLRRAGLVIKLTTTLGHVVNIMTQSITVLASKAGVARAIGRMMVPAWGRYREELPTLGPRCVAGKRRIEASPWSQSVSRFTVRQRAGEPPSRSPRGPTCRRNGRSRSALARTGSQRAAVGCSSMRRCVCNE